MTQTVDAVRSAALTRLVRCTSSVPMTFPAGRSSASAAKSSGSLSGHEMPSPSSVLDSNRCTAVPPPQPEQPYAAGWCTGAQSPRLFRTTWSAYRGLQYGFRHGLGCIPIRGSL